MFDTVGEQVWKYKKQIFLAVIGIQILIFIGGIKYYKHPEYAYAKKVIKKSKKVREYTGRVSSVGYISFPEEGSYFTDTTSLLYVEITNYQGTEYLTQVLVKKSNDKMKVEFLKLSNSKHSLLKNDTSNIKVIYPDLD